MEEAKLIQLIHEYEEVKARVSPRLIELRTQRIDLQAQKARTDRSLASFQRAGTYVPTVLRRQSQLIESALIRNEYDTEVRREEYDAVQTELADAIVAFDSTPYDQRLADEIAQLEAEGIKLDQLDQRVKVIGEQLTSLYLLRDDQYERIKYFLMLDALKERGKRQEQPVGTASIKYVVTEHKARRNRTCKGKKFKNKPREPRKPKSKPDKRKKAKGKGQKNGAQQQAA